MFRRVKQHGICPACGRFYEEGGVITGFELNGDVRMSYVFFHQSRTACVAASLAPAVVGNVEAVVENAVGNDAHVDAGPVDIVPVPLTQTGDEPAEVWFNTAM